MKHWKTDIIGYVKLALACWYAWIKLSNGQQLTTEDMVILGALGLGFAGNKASADASKVAPPQ